MDVTKDIVIHGAVTRIRAVGVTRQEVERMTRTGLDVARKPIATKIGNVPILVTRKTLPVRVEKENDSNDSLDG